MYQNADDSSQVRVVWLRGVAAEHTHSVAQVGRVPNHGIHEAANGLEVA